MSPENLRCDPLLRLRLEREGWVPTRFLGDRRKIREITQVIIVGKCTVKILHDRRDKVGRVSWPVHTQGTGCLIFLATP